MVPEGYVEYKHTEFCKDIKCPIQHELDIQKEGCPAYEFTRQKCGTACLFTTWQFHHWLIEKRLFNRTTPKGKREIVF